MKIVKAYATIHNPFEKYMTLDQQAECLLANVEFGARISHRSEDTEPDTLPFLKRTVMERSDWSVTEHSMVSVLAVLDRGITHEWVRHRHFSFTQESTRFVNYEKKLGASFIYPQVEGEKAADCPLCLAGNEAWRLPGDAGAGAWRHSDGHLQTRCLYDDDWMDTTEAAERGYKRLIAKKWRPQEARSVFPNSLASMILTSGNLRNWRLFFLSRTTVQAHPQVRLVATDLLNQFKQFFPVLYDDIEPSQTQKHNFGLAH